MSMFLRGLLTLFGGAVIGLSLSFGGSVLAERGDTAEVGTLPVADARLFAEVLERVKREYVEPVDDRVLIEAAIRGMVAELDPHSAFLDSDEFREIRISTSGNYSGVGLEVNVEDGRIVVVSPIDGTPAYHAGVRPGDVIRAIDGHPVDSDLDDTVTRMRGEPGTPVALTVERDGSGEPVEFDLRRARIQVASVRSRLLERGFAYVRITHFSETTSRDLTGEILDLIDENGGELRGLVLDLRNNPGGVLDAAVDVSDAFLEEGRIVYAEGRGDDSYFAMDANPGDIVKGAGIVVLVNSGTASASEIVAGALKDHHRAVVMGTTTFGKGSVQTVMPLSDGRAVKLTTSRYFTPAGTSIHELGIPPDIILEGDGEVPVDAAAWLEGAEALLRQDHELRQALLHLKSEFIRQSLAQ